MGWAALAYSQGAAGTNQTNLDLAAASDPDFSQRNSHYIFTESYRLLGSVAVGASLTRGRIQVPTVNAVGEFALWNANRSATVPSNAQWDNFYDMPLQLPQNEEFQIQYSNNLGAATEQEQVLVYLATDDWSANLPRGRQLLQARATITVTPTVNAWSGAGAITMSQSLRGGVYAVIGCIVQGTNSAFFRIIFPRYRLYHGRKLRPGSVVQNAVGDVPFFYFRDGAFPFGEWGRFHTFELPQFEFFGITAASTTYQIFLMLMFMGEDVSQLSQGLGGGL
jgi:hypothetical protein